jgi:hypothetical protein
MKVHYVKKEHEKYPLGFSYQAPDLAPGETITSVVCTISENDIDLVGEPIISVNTVAQIIENGTPGKSGTLVFRVTTSAGYIFVDEIVITVEA